MLVKGLNKAEQNTKFKHKRYFVKSKIKQKGGGRSWIKERKVRKL
jgi:hypothetical protein